MKRSDGSLGQLVFANFFGLICGCAGWCLYQPYLTTFLERALISNFQLVLAGPFAPTTAPTLRQICEFALISTDARAGLVFIGFWTSGGLIYYWIFEWSTRPREG